MNKQDIFKQENKLTGENYTSPSGQFFLSVHPYKTKDGCWNYTEGVIYNKNGTPIATIQRNYSRFPFLWLEDHPKGNFLICGSDYQGQAVVNLDTGEVKEALSEGAEKGLGFCWAEYKFDKKFNILIVDGCYWANPYEYKFFDFSDPMKGWPELSASNEFLFADSDSVRWPKIRRNGEIYYFQSESEYIDVDNIDDYYDENGDLIKKAKIAAIKIFIINGKNLELKTELVSKKEQKEREARKIANQKYKMWKENFEKTDPLYLKFIELREDPYFKHKDSYIWSGITHEGWCNDFNIKETRYGQRLYYKNKKCIDLEWAVETGPIKVTFSDGKTKEIKFFMEHSVESMEQAFEFARNLLKHSLGQALTNIYKNIMFKYDQQKRT